MSLAPSLHMPWNTTVQIQCCYLDIFWCNKPLQGNVLLSQAYLPLSSLLFLFPPSSIYFNSFSSPAPLVTREMFNSITDAINQKNHIPPKPADRCLQWLAHDDRNHQRLINCGALEFFLSQLSQLSSTSRSFKSPDYFDTLDLMAARNNNVVERCGKAGVLAALRMLSEPFAASFLLRLMSFPPNREVVRTTDNILDTLFAFAKEGRIPRALDILDLLAQADNSIRTRMFLELAGVLTDMLKDLPNCGRIFYFLKVQITHSYSLVFFEHRINEVPTGHVRSASNACNVRQWSRRSVILCFSKEAKEYIFDDNSAAVK